MGMRKRLTAVSVCVSVLVVFAVPLALSPPPATAQESCQYYKSEEDWEYGANKSRRVYYGNIYTDNQMFEEAGGWWRPNGNGKLIELCPDQDKARLVCQSQEASTRQEWGNDPSVVWELRDGQVGLVLHWAHSPPIVDTKPIDWGNCMDPGWYVYRLSVDGNVVKYGWLNSYSPPSVTWQPERDVVPLVWDVSIMRIGYKMGTSGQLRFVTPEEGVWNPNKLDGAMSSVTTSASTTTEPEQITTTTTVVETTTTTAPVTTTTVTATTTTTTLQVSSTDTTMTTSVPQVSSTTLSGAYITTMPEGPDADTHRSRKVSAENTDVTYALESTDSTYAAADADVVVSGTDPRMEMEKFLTNSEKRVFTTSTVAYTVTQRGDSSTSTSAPSTNATGISPPLPDPVVEKTGSASVSGQVVAGWVLGGFGVLLVLWGLWRAVRAREPRESQ